MELKDDTFFDAFWNKYSDYVKLHNNGNVADIIYHIANKDRVCWYLWQKYGTEFINLVKEKITN